MEFHGKRWTNALAFEKIAGKQIRRLEIIDAAVDDDFLEIVAKGGSLESLYITSETISDRGISCIARQNAVSSLILEGAPKVTDDCMDAICACRAIQELYLNGTSVSDSGVESIGELPELRSLAVSNTSITDVGIERIASRTISLLSFGNCQITGMGFSTWSQAEKMSFYCCGSKLTDEGFATACRSFSRMWNVDISRTDVGNAGVKSLDGQSPTMLRINNSRIDKEGINWIVANVPIESLELSASQMPEVEVKQLKKPRRLQIMVHDI